MKIQIRRLSPHQNAKVIAVLMALSSLVFLIPFSLITLAAAPPHGGPPAWLFLLMPLFYLIFGYLMVLIGCAVYNALYRFVGGIEFTTTERGD